MKHIFIVNPVSGKGKTGDIVKNIEKVCDEENLEYEIRYTTKPKEAITIAREYEDGEYIIYAVGGDGTLNEVLNGLIDTRNMISTIPIRKRK